MAYITTIEPAASTGPLREAYDRILRARGHLANIYKLSSLKPDLLLAHYAMYMTEMVEAAGISALERESIAAVVAVANECAYAAQSHIQSMREEGASEELIGAVEDGDEPDTEPKRMQRLLYFARKLTLLPNSMGERDVDDLRVVGFTEEEILQVVHVTAYFNFATRLANGLGVDVEE